MTKQEIFDVVTTNLRRQGRQSGDLERGCLYRGPDGCRCAAGWLIPDAAYREDLEGSIVGPEHCEAMGIQYNSPEWVLVRELQVIHDGHQPDRWEREWRLLANSWGLVYTSPASALTGDVK